MKPVLVIGSGPAGLSAAIHAAASGKRVLLFDRNAQPGVKLLATGGGHANLGNLLPMPDWPARFGRQGRFITPALRFFDTGKYRDWLSGLGVPVFSPDGFHLYPISNSAKQVRDALVAEAGKRGVDFRLGTRGERICIAADGRTSGIIAGGETIPGSAVILAVGGKSLPASGSNGDSYSLATEIGHSLNHPLPGLVGLRAAAWDASLAGIVLENASVRFKSKGSQEITGHRELLLTHHGVSGPAVLDLSGDVAASLDRTGGAMLEISWVAGMDRKAWLQELSVRRTSHGDSRIESLIADRLPKRLAAWLCRQAGVPAAVTAATLKNAERDALVSLLGAFRLAVNNTEGWDKAIVTRGGIALGKVNPETLESRIIPRLYFAGEVLDIDGPCGGYNLHWAFASGALAGTFCTR